MPKEVNGQTFVSTDEAAALLQTSRQSFYARAKPHLRVYRFDAKRAPWYKEKEVLELRDGKSVGKARIVLSGITADWTRHLENSGFRADTKLREAVEASLPEDATSLFGLEDERTFLKRGRMSLANGTPICSWDTYYPMELIDDALLAEIKRGAANDIPMALKGKHGLVVEEVEEWYSARMATFEEQTLLRLVTDEAVLILQRASYTKDKSKLVFYSHMVLLASWFEIKREYPVNIWSAA
jgi:DNA-binding GntR family transcriptional regulator